MRKKTRHRLLLLLVGAGLALAAPDKKPAPHAVIAGTVFKDPGLALPGAKVVLLKKGDPKPKKLDEGEANYRGEYLFQVPATQATYIVRATLKGFQPVEKEIAISGEERIEATLVLVPESKK